MTFYRNTYLSWIVGILHAAEPGKEWTLQFGHNYKGHTLDRVSYTIKKEKKNLSKYRFEQCICKWIQLNTNPRKDKKMNVKGKIQIIKNTQLIDLIQIVEFSLA